MYYRFLEEPEAKPKRLKKANFLIKAMHSLEKNLKKLKKKVANLF
jgi:CRISPR/Cas system CSM-associated protein Csm4 (group 5 of RAMP superfamily)